MELFSEREENIGRQFEADMAKFVCLVGMVIVHCMDVLVGFFGYSSGLEFAFGMVLNSIFGAGTFMFCMGLGIAYSESTPAALMKRGVKVFLLGYLLNLACALSYLILLRDVALFLTYAVGLDIMQFAGLALLLFGLLKKLSCTDCGIGVVAAVLSIIGTVFRGFDLGNPAANILCGLFVGSFDYEWLTGGIFPLCNWFIFVAVGYLFGRILRHCTDLARFYRIFSCISAGIVAVYLAIALPERRGMMGSVLRLHHIGLPDALVCIAGAIFAMGVYHAFARVIPARGKALIGNMSRNINSIYCIHWVVIAWLASLWVLAGKPKFSDAEIILFAVVIFAVSAAAARVYANGRKNRNRRKRRRPDANASHS